MDRESIRRAIEAAPEWARFGLTERDEHMRERAADCLAAVIVAHFSDCEPVDPRQMSFAID